VVREGDPLHTVPLVIYLETSVQLVGGNGSKQTPCGKPARSGDLSLAYTSPIARGGIPQGLLGLEEALKNNHAAAKLMCGARMHTRPRFTHSHTTSASHPARRLIKQY
jgi:hypothetical protein